MEYEIYAICTATNVNDLAGGVNQGMKEQNLQPIGGIAMHSNPHAKGKDDRIIYAQAMGREKSRIKLN